MTHSAEELTSLISSLSKDEQIDLGALAWLRGDDTTIEDRPKPRAEAATRAGPNDIPARHARHAEPRGPSRPHKDLKIGCLWCH
jgi:hypothetical protein